MKANKHLMMNNDRAQAGIGTLIIFIAMVLVAAVAAAVLIQTSGVLQEKAQSTGKQAAQEVSSNLMIKGIEGARLSTDAATSETVDLLKVKVALNIGSSPIDLNQVVITVSDGDSINDLVYAANDKTYGEMTGFNASNSSALNMVELATGNTTDLGNNSRFYFIVEQIRDEDESFSQAEPIMNQGDLVNIYISTVSTTGAEGSFTILDEVTGLADLKDSGIVISPRSDVNLIITPEAGGSTTAGFTAPSFGVKKSIAL
jgi:archaeal flagellin FlaB